jgi:hypothetical protein
MNQICASFAALEEPSPLGSPSSDCLYPYREPMPFAKRCFLVPVTLLLFVGVVVLSVLAKDGLYYPQSSTAHRISKASKMSQHQLPELANERQELVPAFPRTSRDVNEGLPLNDVQEILLPRDAAVLASPPLRSPPRS